MNTTPDRPPDCPANSRAITATPSVRRTYVGHTSDLQLTNAGHIDGQNPGRSAGKYGRPVPSCEHHIKTHVAQTMNSAV